MAQLRESNKLDKAFAHWAEAAFYFSLDLSSELFHMIFGNSVDFAEVKSLCRTAIISNRVHAEKTGNILFIKDLIHEEMIEPFIENNLITYTRPSNGDSPILMALYADGLDDTFSDQFPVFFKESPFREKYNSSLSEDFYYRLFEVAIKIDSLIETRQLTTWDRDIIIRNVNIYGNFSPLQNLIYSVDMVERRRALKESLSGLTEEQIETLTQLAENYATN